MFTFTQLSYSFWFDELNNIGARVQFVRFLSCNPICPFGTSSLLGLDIFLTDLFIRYGNERTKLKAWSEICETSKRWYCKNV